MELAPHEHPELIGLNVGSRHAKQHLRTNQYSDFALYNEICRLYRVHCGKARDRVYHELAHNGLLAHIAIMLTPLDGVNVITLCVPHSLMALSLTYEPQRAEL